MPMLLRCSAFYAVILFLAGCAGRQTMWEKKTSESMSIGKTKISNSDLQQKGDEAWQKRLDKTQLESAIAIWEEGDLSDFQILVKLSRAHYLLADGFISFEGNNEAMMKTYQKGVDYAERALLLLSPQFKERVQTGTGVEQAVEIVGMDGVPALYWYAANLGKWALAKGFTTVLFWKDAIKAIMQRCLTLDERFFYAGPHRYFGSFYAKAPSFAGGDLTKSKEHYEKAISLFPEYLATQVLYAEYYAVKSQNPVLFEKTLKEVLASEVEKNTDILPENSIEKKKAERLLGKKEELF